MIASIDALVNPTGLLRIFAAAAALAAATSALAQSSGVMHIVVPFGAGGVQDILARAISTELGAQLGRSVIVENRPGAGGTIGAAAVAKAPADGSTLILAAASHTIAGSLYARLSYDPIRDFTPIAHIGSVDYVLMVGSALPAKSVREFIAYAKANPGKLNYASAGNGSATHLSMAYFAGLAGIDMVHIPLKSTGDAVNEVLAGRSQAVIGATIGAIPFAHEPRIRMLAVTGTARSKFLPELPTVAESGLPGYTFDSWLGLLGPAGIPSASVERLNAAVAAILREPAVLDRLAKQGVEPQAMSADAFGALLRADVAKMARVVKLSGARID